jgi:hypothetical protein
MRESRVHLCPAGLQTAEVFVKPERPWVRGHEGGFLPVLGTPSARGNIQRYRHVGTQARAHDTSGTDPYRYLIRCCCVSSGMTSCVNPGCISVQHIDTLALRPAHTWLPEELDRSTIGLIVGIEADPDRLENAGLFHSQSMLGDISHHITENRMPRFRHQGPLDLVLLARGGIYSDIDTLALRPAHTWLPEELDRSMRMPALFIRRACSVT